MKSSRSTGCRIRRFEQFTPAYAGVLFYTYNLMQEANGKNESGRKRSCGFRFSRFDLIILIAAAFISWRGLQWPIFGSFFIFVIAHFFLFCNVFRIRPLYEYIWGIAFILNFVLNVSLGAAATNYIAVLLIQVPITIIVLIAEMRSPRYHGIFCGVINRKHLAEWMDGGIK